jgi:hypothetical protein
MFILYSVVIGLALGTLLGGRTGGLAAIQVRWAPAVIIGLLVQVVLFTDAVAERVGDLGPALYVGSTLLVLAAVVRNWNIRGMPLVIAGAACNVAAIVANGGYMPADPGALEALGKVAPTIYSNSSVVPQAALWPLTDIFALPRWLPLANIFSVGDLLIGVGIATVIVVAMRRSSSAPASASPGADPPAGARAH